MSKSNIDKILNAIDSIPENKDNNSFNNSRKASTNSYKNNQNNNRNNIVENSIDNIVENNTDNDLEKIFSDTSKKNTSNLKTTQIINEIGSIENIESDNGIKIKKQVHSILSEINRKTMIKTMSTKENQQFFTKTFNIKIIGIGGAGNNIVKYMKNAQVWPDFVQIIALNTDFVALSNMGDLSDIFILGAEELDGNGSGGDPNVGKMAAEVDAKIIEEMIKGTDILILIAGLGKGTGTGATPVIAKIAQDLGILTIGLFNLPSIGAEGNKIYANALSGLQKLSYLCNGLTTVNNDKIISLDRERTSIKKAYQGANKYINEIVVELIEIIVKPSDINIDFADVKNFFEDKNGFLFLKLELNDYSKDAIKESFENAIKLGFSEVNINDSQKALLNFKLNENVPSVILENARSALKEIINTNNINIVHGISYNDSFEGAEINALLIGSFELGSIDDDFDNLNESTDSTKNIENDKENDDIDVDEAISELEKKKDYNQSTEQLTQRLYEKYLGENKISTYSLEEKEDRNNENKFSENNLHSKKKNIWSKFLGLWRPRNEN